MNAEDVVADIKSSITEKKRKRYSGSQGRRSVKRPEEILRDVRGLKLRQRVSLVLGDEILREELEESIKNSTLNGVTKLDTIRAYQDILLPALQPSLVSVGSGGGGGSTVLPINDIRGEHTGSYTKNERILRCKLASVYRLIDIFGWSEAIFNHISVRASPDKNEFLLNPFGFLYNEVTAASLVKVDCDGNVVNGGSTNLGINKAGFVLHSTVHEARPDIHCILHMHTPDVVAVASMKCGFLRISQESLIVGGVSYHDYYGILIDEAEKQSIKDDLGPDNMVMFLRNHGVVVCGKTIEDAFILCQQVMEACEAQVKAVCVGLDNLNIISDEAYEQVQSVTRDAASKVIKQEGKPRMTLSEYNFEAYMRWLDSQGYRTGYIYHMPDIFISGDKQKCNSESRVPPNVPGEYPPHLAYTNYYGTDFTPPGQKPMSMGRGNTHRARLKWLNSPVVGTQYVKEERQTPEKPTQIPEENGVVENGVDHAPTVNGVNGDHVDQYDDAPAVNGDAEIKENGVTEVNLVTVESEITTVVTENEVTVVVNGATDAAASNGDTLSPVVSPTKSATSSDGLNVMSDGDATPESSSTNDGSKPQKVKKQKSFKKALMKKFNKKEDKKDDSK